MEEIKERELKAHKDNYKAIVFYLENLNNNEKVELFKNGSYSKILSDLKKLKETIAYFNIPDIP